MKKDAIGFLYLRTIGKDGVLYRYIGQINFMMMTYYTGEAFVFTTEPDYMRDYMIKEIIEHEGLVIHKIIISL